VGKKKKSTNHHESKVKASKVKATKLKASKLNATMLKDDISMRVNKVPRLANWREARMTLVNKTTGTCTTQWFVDS